MELRYLLEDANALIFSYKKSSMSKTTATCKQFSIEWGSMKPSIKVTARLTEQMQLTKKKDVLEIAANFPISNKRS
jgi:hypothetical protein